jgi:hypothetical protein
VSCPQNNGASAPRRADLRDLHDRLRTLRSDVVAAKALLRADDLAAVRLLGALDLIDGLLRDLERRGMAA